MFSSPEESPPAMLLYEVTFRTSPIDDDIEDALLDDMDAFVATHGDITLITVCAEAACGVDAAAKLIKELRSHGVTVLRIEKDLVNAATIASRCSESRTAVANYIQGTRRTAVAFPAPEVSGSPSLWRWPDVNTWLAEVGKDHDADVNYLTRDEETQIDYRLCVSRSAAKQSFTAVVMPSMTSVRTPADQSVEIAVLKYVHD